MKRSFLRRSGLLFSAAFFIVFSSSAQEPASKVDSSYQTTYYGQKRTLFELLPDGKKEIIFLGNSITDIGEWTEIFQDLRVKNRGISGDNTFGVLARLDEVLSSRPSMIFLMIGINDIAKGIPDEIIVANYRRIIARTRAASPRTRLYLQSVLPTNNSFSEFKRHQDKDDHIQFLNRSLEKLAKEWNAVYVDLYPHFLDGEGKLSAKYTNDGLHLNGPGYMLWKELLIKKRLME